MFRRHQTTASRRARRSAFRPVSEMLEGRQLMTAVPTAQTIDISDQNWQNVQIPTTPMEVTEVDGVLPMKYYDPTKTIVHEDRFRFFLQRGEIADVSLQVMDPGNTSSHDSSSVTIYDVNYHHIAGSAHANADSDVVFIAPSDGWYQASVHEIDSNSTKPSYDYKAKVRPIALDPVLDTDLDPNHSVVDASKVAFGDGGLYAWLSGRSVALGRNGAIAQPKGTSLTLSGPTGRGFTIDGNWSERIDPTSNNTIYSGTGLSLEMTNPLDSRKTIRIPLSVGSSTGMTITVGHDGWDDAYRLYGEVIGEPQFTVANVPVAPSGLLSPGGAIGKISSQLDSSLKSYGISTSLPGMSWGIDLGGQASSDTGQLPLNSAVPYIWFHLNAGDGGGVTVGQISADAGTNIEVNAAIDPEDPSFFFDVKGIPVISEIGAGLSMSGLVPYFPMTAWPTATPFYGDVYARGGLDIAQISEDILPVALMGDVTFNLDPHHYGLANIAQGVASDLTNLLNGKINASTSEKGLQQLYDDARNMQVGVNGTISLSLSLGPLSLHVPVGSGSAEWDGVNHFDFAAGTVDPLSDTVLSFLSSGSGDSITGEFNTDAGGRFDVNLYGTFGLLGKTLSTGHLEIDRGTFGGPVLTTLTGDTDISVNFNVENIGASAEIEDHISMSFDSNGWGSISASGSASASAWYKNDSVSASTSYSWESAGNIGQLIDEAWDSAISILDDSVDKVLNELESEIESL